MSTFIYFEDLKEKQYKKNNRKFELYFKFKFSILYQLGTSIHKLYF